MPVPASSTSNVPASVRTDTHEVLPPYRTVVGPALAIEPLVPQNVTCTPTPAPDPAQHPTPERRRPRPAQLSAAHGPVRRCSREVVGQLDRSAGIGDRFDQPQR